MNEVFSRDVQLTRDVTITRCFATRNPPIRADEALMMNSAQKVFPKITNDLNQSMIGQALSSPVRWSSHGGTTAEPDYTWAQ